VGLHGSIREEDEMARRLKRPAQIALAIVSAFALFTVSSASAATQEIDFVNTGGSLSVGPGFPPLDLPPGSGGMSIEWDDVTGDVTGDTTFNPIELIGVEVLPGTFADLTLTFVPLGSPNVSGNIDPSDGEAVIVTDLELDLGISIPSLAITALCTLGPLEIEWDTLDPDGENMNVAGPRPYTMTLQAIDFVIPALVEEDCDTPGLSGAINTALTLPGLGDAVLPLEEGEVPPPPPTSSTTTSTTTATSTTSSTGGTTGGRATPRFTG
jgi:hypothetical protein